MDYKKYSLDKLQEWVHDALSTADASPHEIYSAIREAVREDYYYHKNCISRASGLLELLSGHRPVAITDNELFEAAIKEREYYEGAKQEYLESMYPDVPEDGSPIVFDYTATGEKFPAVCDKDDPSPECKGAWNDFWEGQPVKADGYSVNNQQHSESYYDYDRNDPDKKNPFDKVTKWQLPVEADGPSGEYFVTFPNDLLEAADLKEGDLIEWVDQGDGSYLLKKHTERYRF